MLHNLKVLGLLVPSSICFGQVQTIEMDAINQKLDSIEVVKTNLVAELEVLKLNWIQDEINTIGTPKSNQEEEIITHSAYKLSYNETHEQANWVMHIILTDIVNGNASRSNDFREDPLVNSGSAQEKDYFLKELKADGSYEYDGYGYDRGHLAPSADFKWSEKALSESFFYSNMSPQIGDFNRIKWAKLESLIREYVISNEVNLIIVTAPVLNDNLQKIERSNNGVSIPEYFVKVALDLKNKRGIGFILPHQKIEKSLASFSVSIDSVEALLGYDLFTQLDSLLEIEIESSFNPQGWLPSSENGKGKAISFKKLPKNSINTNGAEGFINDGRKHTVCGKVVSTKKHEKGHVFLNLDKKFPNQVFSISIFNSSIHNFDYEPQIYLKDQEVCFTAKIGEYNGTASMVIDNGNQVKLLGDY
ncbi:MAG: DNA/RNA non-specific endonuclease [Crocinitomicaceae bacterium]|nr:DNA/RNA non-specific endonuclease [Crocinitomicaceae bacterium]